MSISVEEIAKAGAIALAFISTRILTDDPEAESAGGSFD